MRIRFCVVSALLLISHLGYSQREDEAAIDKVGEFPNGVFNKIRNKASRLDDRLTYQTEKYLERLAKQEFKLQKKLYKKDSVAANNIFAGSEEKYKNLASKLRTSPDPNIRYPLTEYVPGLDSMQAAMRFLSKTASTLPNFPSDKLNIIQAANGQLQLLQGKLQRTNEVEQFIKQREQQLKEQLSQYGLGKELASINKEAFYYQQQLAEYKSILHDPDKLERKILSKLNDVPAFQTFMQKNSYLAQLFGLPDNYSDVASLAGLQTRSQVEQLISNNIGSSSGGVNPEQFVLQQAQLAQQALRSLRNKLSVLGISGGSGDITIPTFKPNNQKTKIFLKRLEYGFNVQTQPTTNFLPTTTSLALLIGYKLKDNISLGVGGSYLLGLGNGVNHIHFSNQGIGIRSYFDIKAKGNIYLSGGFEYNYMKAFENFQSIRNLDIWQKSALIGFSKQFNVSKNRKSNMQLLFDALYKQHSPSSSPIIFRMGYKF